MNDDRQVVVTTLRTAGVSLDPEELDILVKQLPIFKDMVSGLAALADRDDPNGSVARTVSRVVPAYM